MAVERLAGALWAVALCRRVLIETQQRLAARGYGEQTLWHLDTVRQRFAACLVQARQLQALTETLADAVATRHDTVAAAILKATAATTVAQVLEECAHLQGADGFARGGVQQLKTQAALWGIGGGTTEVVLAAVAGAAPSILDQMTL
jgi:citronellyl-CoA dehydrogenase